MFDIEEALSFEGETGPYLQYAAVRANNIFRKLQEREGLSEADVLEALDRTPPDELLEPADAADGDDHALWAVVFEALTPRRSRRSGGAVAGILRVGEIHLRAGADLQRVLPSGTRS